MPHAKAPSSPRKATLFSPSTLYRICVFQLLLCTTVTSQTRHKHMSMDNAHQCKVSAIHVVELMWTSRLPFSGAQHKLKSVALNFLMLNKALALFGEKINQVRPNRSRTLNKYVVNRAIKLLGLLRKLHADYRLDFSDSMIALGQHIQNIDAMKRMAHDFELDLELLLSGDVD